MKSLTELKRRVKEFEWKLIENSWFNDMPAHITKCQLVWRKVGKVQRDRFSLLTDKFGDGNFIDSWATFPKASEMKLINNNDQTYTLMIHREMLPPYDDKPPHRMIYELRLIK